MTEGVTVLDATIVILRWLCPLIFLNGALLLFLSTKAYANLEVILGKEIGGIRKRVFSVLETAINTLHEWMLERKAIVGLVYVVASLWFFFGNK